MSYNRIYGYGDTPHQAFITSKMNEIEHDTKTPFIKKTQCYTIKTPDDLHYNLLELYIIVSCTSHKIKDRKLTDTENKYLQYLKDFYGEKELDKIFKIYKNERGYSDLSITIETDETFKGFKVYKFLF